MRRLLHFLLSLLIVIAIVNAADSGADIQIRLAFEKLKTLEGNWEGTARWIEKPGSEFKMKAVYSLTGRGTAVVEDLIAEGEKTMTSVYHLDGDALRMTHYCGAGNQPRLKALSDEFEDGKIKFQLVDITNLASPDAPHVIGAEIALHGSSDLTLTFNFFRQGKTSTELIQLHRID